MGWTKESWLNYILMMIWHPQKSMLCVLLLHRYCVCRATVMQWTCSQTTATKLSLWRSCELYISTNTHHVRTYVRISVTSTWHPLYLPSAVIHIPLGHCMWLVSYDSHYFAYTIIAEDRSWYMTYRWKPCSVPVYPPPHPSPQRYTHTCTLKEENVHTVTQLITKSVITEKNRECTDVVQ